MRRRRVTYRPSKSQAVFGGVVGIIFICIGLFVVIPSTFLFGGFAAVFGILWTAVAAGITIMNFYRAFGKGYVGPEIHIEDENGGKPGDPQERLRQLQDLYDQKLITQQEYEQKRREILQDL